MGPNKEINEFFNGVVIFCCIMAFICYAIYDSILRRISSVTKLYDRKNLSGVVVKVLDGDGFEFIHTPRFRTTVYLPGDSTLPVRLAGIDAPEMPGNIPGQPFAKESKDYLTKLILKEKITIEVQGIDQYGRLLAFAFLPRGFLSSRINVNLQMVKYGFACLYKGSGAKYWIYYRDLEALEREAKRRKLGMWSLSYITPMEHKRRYRIGL